MKLVLVSAATALSLLLPAFSSPAVPPREGEEGFRLLFNGRDLEGWVYGRIQGRENKKGSGYRVQDGILYCTRDDGGNLFTDREYGDFVFRFEFRLERNGNNGVGIRAPLEGDAAYVGMEVQILDDDGPAYANLRPGQYHGSIYDVVPARRGSLKPAGEWNSEEITAVGSRITVVVNGTTIVDADLDEITDEAVLQKHPGLSRRTGHIGFLGHGTRVEFRNIRIRTLN